MNDYERGYVDAAKQVAKDLRNDARYYDRIDRIAGELLRDLAGEIEKMKPQQGKELEG